jgi:uncharacterized delta-60 repeat protein
MLTLVRISKLLFASVLTLVCSTAAHATVGQPGTLDAFWATGSPLGAGKVVTPVGNGADDAAAMIVQPDGKVLIAGTCAGAANSDFCAVRYDALGVLDSSFGNGGKVITPVGSQNDIATAIALQPDGKVLLIGHCRTAVTYHAFCAVRYNSNGTLDTANFGSGTGKVITPVGPEPPSGNQTDVATSVALQPDGKILVAGSCTNGTTQFCVVRYNNSGSLDTNFGSSGTGKIFTSVGAAGGAFGGDNVAATTIQPDGKILVGGYCANSITSITFCAARYQPDGSLDPSFNGAGTVSPYLGTDSAFANALALQPDGKMLLAGYCSFPASNFDFCAVRLLSSGALDPTFGNSGSVTTSFGPFDDHATTIALQPDGKFLLAGDCNGASDNVNSFFCSARYNPNGTLDTNFGSAGKVLTDFDGHDYATAMALQPDGRILLAGTCSPSTHDFCALRYDGGPFGYQNCKLDIDGDGRVLATTDMLIGTRIALGMTGNAVVGGINFPATATRNTWPLIRDYLLTQCGLSLVQ